MGCDSAQDLQVYPACTKPWTTREHFFLLLLLTQQKNDTKAHVRRAHRRTQEKFRARYNPSFLASSVLRAAPPRSPNHDNQPVLPAAREPSDLSSDPLAAGPTAPAAPCLPPRCAQLLAQVPHPPVDGGQPALFSRLPSRAAGAGSSHPRLFFDARVVRKDSPLRTISSMSFLAYDMVRYSPAAGGARKRFQAFQSRRSCARRCRLCPPEEVRKALDHVLAPISGGLPAWGPAEPRAGPLLAHTASLRYMGPCLSGQPTPTPGSSCLCSGRSRVTRVATMGPSWWSPWPWRGGPRE